MTAVTEVSTDVDAPGGTEERSDNATEEAPNADDDEHGNQSVVVEPNDDHNDSTKEPDNVGDADRGEDEEAHIEPPIEEENTMDDNVTEQIEDNDNNDADEDDLGVLIRRPGLRPNTKRTHPKFGEADGFQSTTRLRFTGGHGAAIAQMSEENIGHSHAAAAIAECQNLNATQSTKQCGVRQGMKVFKEEHGSRVEGITPIP